MNSGPKLEVNGVTIRIPMKLRHRSGRKFVIASDGFADHKADRTLTLHLMGIRVHRHVARLTVAPV